MNNRNQDLVILLTATVTPNTYSKLKVTDPAIRRQQYLEALYFYIEKTPFRIVFAENSGDKLRDFPVLPERIEYLSFKSTPSEPDRGKAFKELEIIDFAIKNSQFLKDSKALAKVTGRLQVLNFNRLAKNFVRLQKKYEQLVYANSYKYKNMDSRCFFFTPDFWPYQMNVGRNISLQYNFELSLWDSIHEYNKMEGKNFKAFYRPLRICGISGFSGNNYKHNLAIQYARFFRNLLRKFRERKLFGRQK